MKLTLLSLCISLFSILQAQTKGCKDKQANNYNPQAQINDGSCTYNKTFYTPGKVCTKLSDTILETSGLIHYNNLFWTLNDSDNPPIIYAFDSLNGHIIHQTYIYNASNTDWEDLSQDSLFIYIGEFGNNAGKRKDLKILKIKKSNINMSVFTDTVPFESIRFEMNDQTDFNPPQDHNFDLEAFCIIGDSIHLFSKNRADRKSRHYMCSKDTGFYSLSPLQTFEVDGLITGASTDGKGIVILTGYNTNDLSCFIYLLWDHSNNTFNDGNKRRIDIGNFLNPGQNEAVCILNNTLYMSNEKQISDAQFHRIQYMQWIIDNPSSLQTTKNNKVELHSNGYELSFTNYENSEFKTLQIMNVTGKIIYSQNLGKDLPIIDISNWNSGIYFVKLDDYLFSKLIIAP